MKASEAKRISTEISDRSRLERAAQAKRSQILRVQKEKERRKIFYKEFSEEAAQRIEFAVKAGEKSTRLSIGRNVDSPVAAQEQFDKHEYLPEIKRVMRNLRSNGYTVINSTMSQKHTTEHESSVPDYDYWQHFAYIDISWE